MEEQPQQDQQAEPNLQSYPPTPIQSTNGTQKNGRIKWMKLSLIPLVVVIILIYGYFAYKTFLVRPVIKSYEECIKAKGSLVQPSYPPVCVTKGGLRFTQEVISITPPLTKAEECYEQIANFKCPEGAQCSVVTNETAFCNCMGGLVEIREEGTEGQYEACVINGEDYTDITFQEFEQGWYWGSYDQRKLGTPDNWAHSLEGTRSAAWHKPIIETNAYLLEKSEGSCTNDTLCVWAGEGCGGGHGICTNDPEKYKDIVTTCDIDNSFPANRGYTCGCIETLNKCGWKK